jgi:hypothetical protein
VWIILGLVNIPLFAMVLVMNRSRVIPEGVDPVRPGTGAPPAGPRNPERQALVGAGPFRWRAGGAGTTVRSAWKSVRRFRKKRRREDYLP